MLVMDVEFIVKIVSQELERRTYRGRLQFKYAGATELVQSGLVHEKLLRQP